MVSKVTKKILSFSAKCFWWKYMYDENMLATEPQRRNGRVSFALYLYARRKSRGNCDILSERTIQFDNRYVYQRKWRTRSTWNFTSSPTDPLRFTGAGCAAQDTRAPQRFYDEKRGSENFFRFSRMRPSRYAKGTAARLTWNTNCHYDRLPFYRLLPTLLALAAVENVGGKRAEERGRASERKNSHHEIANDREKLFHETFWLEISGREVSIVIIIVIDNFW